MGEKRIYVVVAATIQVPLIANSDAPPLKTVLQPHGRQIAQACHVVSKLRFYYNLTNAPNGTLSSIIQGEFEPITTIILQARDSAEMEHVFYLLNKKHLNPDIFCDDNPEYGPGSWPTAIAVFATPQQVRGVLDYIPLWGS